LDDKVGFIFQLKDLADRERWSRFVRRARDHLFLEPNGEIVKIVKGKSLPHLGADPFPPDLLDWITEASAKGEVESVVEIRPGNAGKLGISVGDRVYRLLHDR